MSFVLKFSLKGILALRYFKVHSLSFCFNGPQMQLLMKSLPTILLPSKLNTPHLVFSKEATSHFSSFFLFRYSLSGPQMQLVMKSLPTILLPSKLSSPHPVFSKEAPSHCPYPKNVLCNFAAK